MVDTLFKMLFLSFYIIIELFMKFLLVSCFLILMKKQISFITISLTLLLEFNLQQDLITQIFVILLKDLLFKLTLEFFHYLEGTMKSKFVEDFHKMFL